MKKWMILSLALAGALLFTSCHQGGAGPDKKEERAFRESLSLECSDDREAYSGDEAFANFRELTGGKIRKRTFYRSASPCDVRSNRASYANALMEEAHVRFVLNLSDNEADYLSYRETEGFSSAYYDELYRNATVRFLALDDDYSSDEFAKTLAETLLNMSIYAGPVLVHGEEGKDRTGYVSALLLALADASDEEIMDDYMITYENYYGITRENHPAEYAILVWNIEDFLYDLCEPIEEDAPIGSLNLSAGARNYLKKGGLTEEEIRAIIDYVAPVTVEETDEVEIEAFPTASGEHAVSDGEYLFFAVRSDANGNSMNKAVDGLYRTDLSLQNPVRLARGKCHSLTLDGDTLYFSMEDFAGVTSVCSVNKDGSGLTRIVKGVTGAENLGKCGNRLFYVETGSLCIVEIGGNTVQRIDPSGSMVLQAGSSADGRSIWFSAINNNTLTITLHQCDPEKDKDWAVIPIGNRFTVGEEGVYFLYSVENQPAYEDYRQYEYVLMQVDENGESHVTGLTGRFAGDFCAYGKFLFYCKYVEEEIEGKGPCTIRRLFCYDTKRNTETALKAYDRDKMDTDIRGVTAGRLFYNSFRYTNGYAEEEELNAFECADLTKPGTPVDLTSMTGRAENTAAVERDDVEIAAYIAAREREKEEELKNTKYGPGTSSLYLKAQGRAGCYRLVRMDGSTEFQVLLEAGESRTMTFPCGKYILKVARGETWISDEEAFGPKGTYSTTDVFNFASGAAYEISTGTQGSFRSDSQSGFTN